MVQIHPTAIVHPKSEIEDGVEIGPYAVVHEGAKIGAGTKIDAHAVIFGCVTLGKNNYVGCGVVIGSDPQDLSFKGQETFVKNWRQQRLQRVCNNSQGNSGGKRYCYRK